MTTRRAEIFALGLAAALHVALVVATRAVRVADEAGEAKRRSDACDDVAELSTAVIDAPELAALGSLDRQGGATAGDAVGGTGRGTAGDAVLTGPRAAHGTTDADTPGAALAPAPAPALAPAPEPGAAWSFSSTRVVTDVGAARFGAAPADVGGSANEPDDAASAQAATNALLEGLTAHDIASGTSRGGPLLAAVEEAARQPEAPSLGVAVFDVTVSREGAPQVSLVDAKDDAPGWTKLGAAIARAAARRQATVRLPERATAIRVRIRVEAVDRLADGTDVAAAGKTTAEVHRGTLERTGNRADLPHAELAHKGRLCSVRAGIDPFAPYVDGSCSPENALPPQRRVAARILSETRL